jgi:nucleotide-binding universal stress UspA family protein
MMSTFTILVIGAFAFTLLTIFVYVTIQQLRKAGQESSVSTVGTAESGTKATQGRVPPAPHPMRILLATDGSPCSDVAVETVAQRPWPAGTEVKVITVVHTRVPFVPDPALIGAAAYATALERDRRQAPERIRAAERSLAGRPGLAIRSTVLEGDPETVIIEEADRWKAELVVVGSHGYGPVKRLVLGSVSQGVASHAPCSVEIVRCRHGEV